MAQRMAGAVALVVFSICLFVGLNAGNPFTVTVLRALVAMLGTFAVGLVVGWMGRKMIEESVQDEKRRVDARLSSQSTDR